MCFRRKSGEISHLNSGRSSVSQCLVHCCWLDLRAVRHKKVTSREGNEPHCAVYFEKSAARQHSLFLISGSEFKIAIRGQTGHSLYLRAREVTTAPAAGCVCLLLPCGPREIALGKRSHANRQLRLCPSGCRIGCNFLSSHCGINRFIQIYGDAVDSLNVPSLNDNARLN